MVSFVGSTTDADAGGTVFTNTTSPVAPMPAGIASGDVAIVSIDFFGTGTTVTLTGYSSQLDNTGTASDHRIVYTKTLTGSETNVAPTMSVATWGTLQVLVLRGLSSSTPNNKVSQATSFASGGGNFTNPSLTIAAATDATVYGYPVTATGNGSANHPNFTATPGSLSNWTNNTTSGTTAGATQGIGWGINVSSPGTATINIPGPTTGSGLAWALDFTASASGPVPVSAQFPPTFYIQRHYPLSRKQLRPQQVGAVIPNLFSQTLTAPVSATGTTSNSIGKIIAGVIAVVAGTVKISLTKIITGIVVVAGTVNRSITRTFTAVLVVLGVVSRRIQPIIKASAILTGSSTRTISRTIQGTFAVAGQTARVMSRVLSTVTVTSVKLTRTVGRALSAVIVATANLALTKVRIVALSATMVVNSTVTRQVKPVLSASLAVVTKTVRSAGFTVKTVITVSGAVSRSVTVRLKATAAAISGFTAARVHIITGALFIIIPGSCAKIVKGLFTQTLPKLIVKLTGFPGTTSVFNITLPNPVSSATMTRNRLRILIPPPKTSLHGFSYPPMKIKLPSPAVNLTGKTGHVGSFNIDFGNCFAHWRYLMSMAPAEPVTVQAPEDINWVIGGTLVTRWKTGVPGTRWSIGKLGDFSQSQLSTDYIRVGVSARINNAQYNPTGDVVKFAFMPNTVQQPQPSDWNTGSWETTTSIIYPYKARCLVGPNGVRLGPGSYTVYIQIADNPETVVSPLGMITVF